LDLLLIIRQSLLMQEAGSWRWMSGCLLSIK
jgi:hypothetical protein